MQLNDDDIREFKEAYEAEFHETISDAEAREMAARVMRIVELIIEPPSSKRDGPCAFS